MTSVVLLRTCFVSACANTLLNKRDSRSLNLHKAAAVVARRTTRLTAPAWRLRLRRRRAAVPRLTHHPHHHQYHHHHHHHPELLDHPLHSFALFRTEIRKRIEAVPRATTEEKKDQRRPMEQMLSLHGSLDEEMTGNASSRDLRRHVVSRGGSRDETKPRRIPDEVFASPSSQTSDHIETRSMRSGSSASRSTNRLSLTLPIAPPNAYPTRPPPVSSATVASFPPTPLDTPSLTSPIDSNDFITAIAAQERRVLELREDLGRAEADLEQLKKQWATHEAYKKRGSRRRTEASRGLGPAAEFQDEVAIRRSIELDRRKALLGHQQQQQQDQQATPERSKRRVFTGSHTRTLSLLSPTKPDDGFPLHGDDPLKLDYDPQANNRYAPVTPGLLAKRASWAPRTTQPSGVNKIAQDLKTGIWTFMEDLRQATVGDEPITGQGVYLRGVDGNFRAAANESPNFSRNAGDQDTIRPPASARPKVMSAFDDLPSASDTQAPESDNGSDSSFSKPPLRRSKTDASKPTKRFSWTPLTMDALDDSDWSNWNNSPSAPSPRWSGTTVNGDIIPSVPEKHDDLDTPLKKNSSKSRLSTRSASPSPNPANKHKLEELLPPVLNSFTPSNIKRTADYLMKEWERSLSPPDMYAASAAATAASKEKGT
ncbi:hypothetical protein QBC35DRAFT_372823 [Podospora australis]|uniref:DUF4048 domain-containing protein n=1 Tax=Podospora australis TaxID=1536484 RepID=A0AAN7ANW0_9PEZI|nr:hypothetical protein QBC35DRAFT_372823 [Podospora australis]